ncbi:MAG: hypothetical protein OXC11_03735 [Rhodospirillales bacterium]|nr:hypothetical protein [Rhodospirillales bacterium]
MRNVKWRMGWFLLAAGMGLALRPAQRERPAPPPPVFPGEVQDGSGPRVFPGATCGTPHQGAHLVGGGAAHTPHAFADIRQDTSDGLPDGTPLWYRQNPPLLRVDRLSDGLAFDDFAVLGDRETLELERWSNSEDGYVTETWARVGTREIAGRTVSVFNPHWDEAALRDSQLWSTPRGFDRPLFEFGGTGASHYAELYGEGAQFGLYVAVMPLNTPVSRVERIDARTQYASHVVNLVMPEVTDSRISSGNPDWQEVIRRFYLHFPDEYDSIAINFSEMHSLWSGAFHSTIQNQIAGLGREAVFDDSGRWGSSGRLRSIEGYANTQFSSIQTSLHEMAHQWVDYWNWSELAGGIERAGHQPGAHAPLFFPGEAFTSAVLSGPWKRVAQVDSGFVIEETPAPARYHPTTLYRMGLIGADAVPDLLVFENQNQPGLSIGDTVEGGTRPVRIEDIRRMHGERSGPVDDEWRRATIVVSRDGLISREEMSFWNFLAMRHEATAGVTTTGGVGGFHQATHGMAELHSDVTPKGAPKIINAPPMEVGSLPIHPREFLDVHLDHPVPTLLLSSSELTLSGVVEGTERRNSESSLCGFVWGEDVGGVFRNYMECTAVGSRGRFFLRLPPMRAGYYYVALGRGGWLGIWRDPLIVVSGK